MTGTFQLPKIEIPEVFSWTVVEPNSAFSGAAFPPKQAKNTVVALLFS